MVCLEDSWLTTRFLCLFKPILYALGDAGNTNRVVYPCSQALERMLTPKSVAICCCIRHCQRLSFAFYSYLRYAFNVARKRRYDIPVPTWACPHCGFVHKPADLMRVNRATSFATTANGFFPTDQTVSTQNRGKTVERGRIENLRPWKPGQSGNPGGRPKKDIGAEIARAVIERNQEAICRAMSKALLRGNAHTFEVLANRAYGKVPNKVELTGMDGGPVEYRLMSDADLQARMEQLQNELGLVPIGENGR